MKIKSIAAVGAMGLGLGIAGLVGGTATASAEECGEMPIGITPGNIICNVTSNAGTFAESISPQRNIDIFLYGEADEDGNPSGLGIVDQPGTFAKSVGRFLSGPIAPDGPSTPAAPHAPGAGSTDGS
jgi:hypothetical protein